MDNQRQGSITSMQSTDHDDEDDESCERKPAAESSRTVSDPATTATTTTTAESDGEENGEDSNHSAYRQAAATAAAAASSAEPHHEDSSSSIEQKPSAAAAAGMHPEHPREHREGKRKAPPTTQPSGKRTKKPKDMPRRPLSAYNIFFQRERAKILALHGQGEIQQDFNVSPGELGEEGKSKKRQGGLFQALARTIADRWKALSKDERAKFDQLAEVEMQHYRKRMDQYRQDMIAQTLDKQRKRRASQTSTSQSDAASMSPTAGPMEMPLESDQSRGQQQQPANAPLMGAADPNALLALQSYLGASTAGLQQQHQSFLQPTQPPSANLDLARFLTQQQARQPQPAPAQPNYLQQLFPNSVAAQQQQAYPPQLLHLLLGGLQQLLGGGAPQQTQQFQAAPPPVQDVRQYVQQPQPYSIGGPPQPNLELLNLLLQQQQPPPPAPAPPPPPSVPTQWNGIDFSMLNAALMQQQQPPPPPPPQAQPPASSDVTSLMLRLLQQQQQQQQQGTGQQVSEQTPNEEQDDGPSGDESEDSR